MQTVAFCKNMEKIYSVADGVITVHDTTDFSPKHILECGQIFRYEKLGENYKVIANNRLCTLIKDGECVIIKCSDTDYFVNFFDLDRDYGELRDKISKLGYEEEVNYGKGIRLLRQEPFEMLVSFIISANNHIPRIRNTIEKLCRRYGVNRGSYYAFPTAEALSEASVSELRLLGLGYRAEYILDTAKAVRDGALKNLESLSDDELRQALIAFRGVGGKVADCIMLFGYSRYRRFPVDTWVVKAYGREKREAKALERELTEKYGDLSGFVQQYVFYYKRNNPDVNIKSTQRGVQYGKTDL